MAIPKHILKLADDYNFYALYDEYNSYTEVPSDYPFADVFKAARKIAIIGNDDTLHLLGFSALGGLSIIEKEDSKLTEKILLNKIRFANYCICINDLEDFLTVELQNLDNSALTKSVNDLIALVARTTKAPLRTLPDFLLQNRIFLEAYAKANNVPLELVDTLVSSEYSEELEQQTLQALKTPTIDQYLRDFMETNVDINSLSLQDLAALKMMSLKQLHLGSPESEINFNNFKYIAGTPVSPDNPLLPNRGKGVYLPGEDSVNISILFSSSPEDAIQTTLHEDNHAEQAKLIKAGSVHINPKVILYSMDNFIRDYFHSVKPGQGESYYNENYLQFSSEFDAEKLALEQFLRIVEPNSTDPMYDFLSRFIPGLEIPEEIDRKAQTSTIRYQETTTRYLNGSETSVDQLFLAVIQTKLKHSTYPQLVIEDLKDQYPALLYRFTYDNGSFRKKSEEELVQDYSSATDPVEKEKILTIIATTIDEHFTKRDETKDNIDDLNIALEESLYRDEIIERLKTLTVPIDLTNPGYKIIPGNKS